ncbi:MAG TPA: sigma 54-interacting transcriptional regulator [Clostridia bacterium]|nr:sigma 54-interacting transcriptional regulator [Clostridia bacterium]
MKKIEEVLQALHELENKTGKGISAPEISSRLGIDRTNISRYLNRLFLEKKVEKIDGRPVLYCSAKGGQGTVQNVRTAENSLDKLAGVHQSLQVPVQQAKAAILYPPNGLHTLILGGTGVGKSMFAELMYQFAAESGVIAFNAPFIRFNCADYADNPQLLIAQIFGVKKGAYTGADRDRDGLLKKADGGIFLLDEVHRLSPQGQEMLFTFIDKGCFEPLGETEKNVYADVRIIAATTEEPQSFLLNTFTRRIPMIIRLPSLKDRGLNERFYLVESFLRQEAKRIGKSIYIDKNSVTSFLLYDCPNNIGQLKSDIQLACARAFVNYKAKNEEYILVSQPDLPQHVKKGMLNLQRSRNEVDHLLKSKGDILRYSSKEEQEQSPDIQLREGEDFYDIIEKKLQLLKESGMKEEEINHIVNMDIESHFKEYIGELPEKLRRNEISKIVAEDVMELVMEIIGTAQEKLRREYDERIRFGLLLHINSFVERVRKGISIYHPKLNSIRVEYPDEFLAAMEAAKLMDERLGIHTPLDEIGYLTMFLASNPLEANTEEKDTVGILVIMHGNSTASSMVEVCNSLVGAEHAVALDMPLIMSPDTIYSAARNAVVKLDKGRGVLLMVDMGSLVNFGDMISEETGSLVKTISAVSTPLVMDACNKAVMGRDIYYIYDSIKEAYQLNILESTRKAPEKKNVIITACFTGDGASRKLKEIIESKLEQKDSIEVIPLEILNKHEFLSKVERFREKYSILAVVSTIDVKLENVTLIPAIEVLSYEGIGRLDRIIRDEDTYRGIKNSLKEHLVAVDCDAAVDSIRRIIDDIEASLKVQVKNEVKIGIILHMCFLLDKLRQGGQETVFSGLSEFYGQYGRELGKVSRCLAPLEKHFGIKVGEHETAYICQMFLSNNELGAEGV